ncbi:MULTISPECIES: Lrp/AsnC family transcriptional regulator [Vibrio]|uniref:Lrp/AsnC family transcriptional regulator n=1 Tax=Vibrio neptunius TaxID=170651 RepID=A0ABS3A8Q6_9VIBR|nr:MULTISPECIES: Lrp/AsnC family transcriptional regulator [Vibrio]MBN3495385.1 Lrp/AsnC family transcriptional regulator [Vibrio neptunius]MBN3517895.1 Lrp/AsnC family transcriptional regulator [Vibrio neptunius]MBN3552236.1 Lrp/AsnC family transcriptional regulator [Vibrio neptunius]MBN3580231.1 Lrp/AsnC family transcriptional regulator [Vibrio neptunius]MCH9873897.1 Lrp/AsnC family transcriptional regulator [Vibrio neptunius]
MNKFDDQILSILKHDARASVTDIARQVNLSRSAVTARIQKLEQENVILGYHANIAQDETDLIQAYMALKFDMSESSHYCEYYAETICNIEGVKGCHAITGETDMMLFVEVPTMTRLNEIRDQLQAIPELRHLMTHTVLTEFLNTRHVS